MFCSFTFQWVVVWGLIFTSKHFILWRVNGDNVMEYKNGWACRHLHQGSHDKLTASRIRSRRVAPIPCCPADTEAKQ